MNPPKSSNASNIPYRSDPDFRSWPPARPSAGPGEHLTPQEREIVRRLPLGADKDPALSIEALETKLPNGVTLSPEQKSLLQQLLTAQTSGDPGNMVKAAWLQDYRIMPPNIQEFLDEDYFLGTALRRSASNEGLWPGWREWLCEHASLGSFLHNLVLSGAIGIGKSTIMVTLVLYYIAKCACLRDPHLFYGLSRGSPIDFLLLSLSQSTLRGTVWVTALRLMGSSPFFREHCGYDYKKNHSGLTLVLRINPAASNEIRLTLSGGSKCQHHMGRNVLGVGLDEGNFRLEADPQAYATELFLDLRARMASRFQALGSFMPGLSIVASSAGHESCFTERLIEDIENAVDPNAQLVVRQALYHLKPLKLRSWWFKVSYGIPNIEPAIATGCYNEAGQPIATPPGCPAELAKSHEVLASCARWELVPGDFYKEFARSPRKALQQLSGIPLGGSNRLFPSMADIHRCLELSARDGVPVPCQARILSVSDEDTRAIWDDLNHKAFVRRTGANSYEPIRHPQRLRYAHLDLANIGLAGIAICHLADAPPAPGESAGLPVPLLIVEYDFVLTLGPGRARPICFDKILQFICWLRYVCGYRFGLITADSFQSEHLLQTLHAKGFSTGPLSVDRDKRAYYAWQGGFQNHCIRFYRQEQLLKEAGELIETDRKIDHRPGGTKDTTDGAAGAYLNAIQSEETRYVATPQDPAPVIGISAATYAGANDPFGFLNRIKPRQPHECTLR